MVYVARRKVDSSGIYGFLREQERLELDRWEGVQRQWMKNGFARERYPRQVRLDAFAAGKPVNVAVGEIWGWNAVKAGAPPVARPARGLSRAIVGPDDTVTWSDDDVARLFLEENGL